MSKGLSKIKELFWYSDSEPNELLIACCHTFCLPLTIWVEFEVRNSFLIVLGIISGLIQFYSILWKDCLKYRLLATQFAVLISIGTIYNLWEQNLLYGSRVGWVIIGVFALWNMIRVFKEKIVKYG